MSWVSRLMRWWKPRPKPAASAVEVNAELRGALEELAQARAMLARVKAGDHSAPMPSNVCHKCKRIVGAWRTYADGRVECLDPSCKAKKGRA